MTHVYAAILLAAFATFLSPAAASADEISTVVFQQDSDYKFGEDMLKFNVQSRKGIQYDEKMVNDDIKRLHSTGFFADVTAETKKTADGKVEIIFKTTPKPIVKSVTCVGCKKFSPDKLKDLITVTADAPLNDERLKDSAAAIRSFYADKGYNDATVTPKLEQAGKSSVNVVFDINENLRLKVDTVTFEGNTAYSSGSLKDAIATRHSYLSWLLEVGLLDRTELEKDSVRLRELYWQKGYLDFKVKETKVTEDPSDPEWVNIHFILEEGQPYQVGKISFAGNSRFPSDELVPLLKIMEGETFDSRTERKDIDAIGEKYYPLGYADFMCKSVRQPNYQTHKVDIEYHMMEGGIFTINEIYISGNKITKDKVIRRELPMVNGDPVDRNMIKVSKDRLMGMGYFEEVDAAAINSDVPNKKDIDIKVKEKDFIHAKIGAGYSDTDSLAGMVELSHTNVDILDPKNYFSGGGQRMRLAALYGIDRYDFNADFTEPWLFDMPLKFDISGYFKNVIYKHWEEQRGGFTTSLTKRFFDDFTSASVGYTFENVRVHHMDSGMSQIFQDETGSDLVSRIHLILDRDTRDSATDPTSGYDLNLLSSLTSKIFGASNNYYRVEGKGVNYLSFFDKMIVLSTAGKIGAIGRVGDPHKQVPIYERYFLGGGDSIRGFPYRSIGPVDDEDMNYGGQFMYLFTAEATHPIYDFIRGAVFIDIGDVQASRFGPFDDPNIGIGYGLRIKIPRINAPIKLDLAYPILSNQENVRKTIRFHFNTGFSF